MRGAFSMDEEKENHSVEEKQEELEERVENELISALNRKDKEAVLKLVEDSHPIDLAYALEEASDSDIVFLAAILPDQQMAEIIEQADDELQVRIMKLFDLNKIIRIFQHMSKDDIVDILGGYACQPAEGTGPADEDQRPGSDPEPVGLWGKHGRRDHDHRIHFHAQYAHREPGPGKGEGNRAQDRRNQYPLCAQ